MKLQGNGVTNIADTGVVRIINSIKDFDQVQMGDIVVTRAATPDFVLILDKAMCLITDEGGITSHIAIVCRELDKPAIVGTGEATKQLKDGDLIHFNCQLGSIDLCR